MSCSRGCGTSFVKQSQLEEHLKLLEEAKKRDHRKLGRELDLFSISEDGPGMPFYHPKGVIIWNELLKLWREEHAKDGYMEIRTPQILNKRLWEQSGHWDNYAENMYFTEVDDTTFALKPMNCPGAMLWYLTSHRSYRDLPCAPPSGPGPPPRAFRRPPRPDAGPGLCRTTPISSCCPARLRRKSAASSTW